MLLMLDSALDQWYDEEAVAFLHERAAENQKKRGVIDIV